MFCKRTGMFHLSNKSTPLVLAVFLQAKFAMLQIAAPGQLYLIVCTLNCHPGFNCISISQSINIYMGRFAIGNRDSHYDSSTMSVFVADKVSKG